MTRFRLLLPLLLLALSQPALAWKPTTHVYLALRALAEINLDEDLLGNPKTPGTVVFYRVNYQTGEVLEKLGEYPANTALVNALTIHRKEFVMGVLGPDAYPDIATGQTRTHVREPVYTDRWLTYLWNQAQGKDAMIQAFVFGYLTHAAGDMFMHTFVNRFAGGPFAADFYRAAPNAPLNFNGGRHFVLEGYVGTRTPPLNMPNLLTTYDLGETISSPLREFIYQHLADARAGTVLGDEILIVKPYLTADLDYEGSLPRAFSNLRNGLQGHIDFVDDSLAAFDASIRAIYRNAEEQSCQEGERCSQNPLALSNSCKLACTTAATQAAPLEAAKLTFQGLTAASYVYSQNWIADIDAGLQAWIDLNHRIAQLILFHPPGESGFAEAEALGNEYAEQHLTSMLGAPDAVGGLLGFVRAMQEQFLGDLEAQLQQVEENVLAFMFQAAFGMSIDDWKEAHVSPQALFNDVLTLGYDNDDFVAQTIDLAGIDALLGIEDPSATDHRGWMDEVYFAPAFNTMTLIKLMLLSETGLEQLFTDLGVNCEQADCSMNGNVMLGFVRSLDESTQWLPDHPSENHGDALEASRYPLRPFAFETCTLYRELFKYQLGEYEGAAYTTRDGSRTVEARPCEPAEPLPAPQLSLPGGSYDTPPAVAITHPLQNAGEDVEIYYTLHVNGGVEVEPERSAFGQDSRVKLYSGPITIPTPLDPSQLPITLRVRAYAFGYRPSETVVEQYDTNARLPTPVFSQAAGEYLEPFTVAITVPDAPVGTGIFYTLTEGDTGADPDYNDAGYSGPLELSRGTYTLKAVAYRPGYVRSDIAEASFRIYAPSEVEFASAPFFVSPRGSGIYTNSVQIEMDTHTQDGVIRWTIGQDQLPAFDPTETLGNAYTGPFNLPKGNWFIRAITFKDGLFPSEIAQINVNVVDPLGTTAPPTVRPAGGVFHNDVEVQLVSAVTFVNNEGQTVTDSSGLQLQYTLDGSDPDINPNFNPLANRRYTQPFTLRRSATLRALAYRTFFPISDITEATFELVCATPEITPGTGVFYDSVQVALGTITNNATIRYTLDGSEPTETSPRYEGPFTLTESATVQARAFKNGYAFSEVASANVHLETSSPPLIVRPPRSVEALLGGTAVLAVQGDGVPAPAYQWFFDGELLEGATDDTLRVDPVTEADAGTYTVTLTNVAGTATSAEAALVIVPEPTAPQITDDLPSMLEVALGEGVTFGITTSGTPEPSYRWLRNGQLLPAQTSAAIAYEAADIAHAATYQVIATNAAGADTSTAMQLIIQLDTNVSVEDGAEVPETFDLGQNYPNPFNPTTTIPFAVPQASHVRLTIYDVAGRQVAVLLDRTFVPGRYTATFDGHRLASGLYFYRFEAEDWVEVRKLVLVK